MKMVSEFLKRSVRIQKKTYVHVNLLLIDQYETSCLLNVANLFHVNSQHRFVFKSLKISRNFSYRAKSLTAVIFIHSTKCRDDFFILLDEIPLGVRISSITSGGTINITGLSSYRSQGD